MTLAKSKALRYRPSSSLGTIGNFFSWAHNPGISIIPATTVARK